MDDKNEFSKLLIARTKGFPFDQQVIVSNPDIDSMWDKAYKKMFDDAINGLRPTWIKVELKDDKVAITRIDNNVIYVDFNHKEVE